MYCTIKFEMKTQPESKAAEINLICSNLCTRNMGVVLFFPSLLVGAPTTRKVGSIADYDPVHESYGSLVGQGYRQENSQIDTGKNENIHYFVLCSVW